MNKSRLLFTLFVGALFIQSFIVFYDTSPVLAAITTQEQVITPRDSDFESTYSGEWVIRTQNVVSNSVDAESEGIRIEYEAKLKVPLDQTDAIWKWLQMRYTDCSWLDQDGYVFQGMFGDEDFTDTYFDTPNLQMLAEKGGVRHRMRVVHSGPAENKDGRELIQIKLNRDDPTGHARSEIKFEVSAQNNGKDGDDTHPLLGLVKRNQREEFKAVLHAMGIDPYTMRPVLVLEQNRRRIYLSDQEGAFATLTLDLSSTNSWGTNLRWAEIELELNEIRYTQVGEVDRQKMGWVIRKIQDDLQQAFPTIVPDQTPKYNTAFAAIEATTWLPLRQLIQWEMSVVDFITIVLVFLLTTCGVIWYSGRWVWMRIS